MMVQTSLFHPAPVPLRPATALVSAGADKAPAETYGPSRPETLEGVYSRPFFPSGSRRGAVPLARTGSTTASLMSAACRFAPVPTVGALLAGAAAAG